MSGANGVTSTEPPVLNANEAVMFPDGLLVVRVSPVTLPTVVTAAEAGREARISSAATAKGGKNRCGEKIAKQAGSRKSVFVVMRWFFLFASLLLLRTL